MPRLNYGTLLENAVVLETVRLCLEEAGDDLAFATSFAMPPFTECWSTSGDRQNSPRFDEPTLMRIAGCEQPPTTLRWFWRACITTRAGLSCSSYLKATDETNRFDFGGPNAALLAVMLANSMQRRLRLWVNDSGDRYGTDAANIANVALALAPNTNAASTAHPQIDTRTLFPDSIEELECWLQSLGLPTQAARIAFLDPDSYGSGAAKVSTLAHERWLRTLAKDSERAISVIFFAYGGPGVTSAQRTATLNSVRNDAADLYPHSLTFTNGSYAVAVKCRWNKDEIKLLSSLRARVNAEWNKWGKMPLATYIDGVCQSNLDDGSC